MLPCLWRCSGGENKEEFDFDWHNKVLISTQQCVITQVRLIV